MKDRIKTVINNLTEKSVEINKTLISIDTNGNISIENFKKLLQCTDAVSYTHLAKTAILMYL